LSTLTKVLIVLLTVFSIFLCGIVVTYVANAENQRERAEGLQRTVQIARSRETQAQQELDDQKKATEVHQNQLNAQIATLDLERKKLVAQLDDIRRQNNQLLAEIQQQRASASQANDLSAKHTQMYETAQQQVRTLEADLDNRTRELNETNQMLLERMAVISQLQTQVRRLTEEYTETQNQLNQYLQQYGRIAMRPPTTVPPSTPTVHPMQPVATTPTRPTRTIDLNGQITDVDLKSRLVEVSIGAAAGVRHEMKFHITRGDRWVADLVILEVWPDKAVGIVDLVQQGMEPRAGDRIATNL
jgi:hypothetical protein